MSRKSACSKSVQKAKKVMTLKDASRIQSAAAKAGDGTVKKGSFAARAMSAAARNALT